MANFTVAALVPADYTKELGNKGTDSDITFYNLKRGDTTVTFIEPTCSRRRSRLSFTRSR
jgi:selenocysteine-specific translation elongation factor